MFFLVGGLYRLDNLISLLTLSSIAIVIFCNSLNRFFKLSIFYNLSKFTVKSGAFAMLILLIFRLAPLILLSLFSLSFLRLFSP